MKTAITLLVSVLFLSHRVAHGQETNRFGVTSVSSRLLPLEYSALPGNIFKLSIDYIEEKAETRLVRGLLLDEIERDPEIPLEEISGRRGRKVFRDGMSFALREWFLDTPLGVALEERGSRIGDWFSSFFRDTLSGREERNNVFLPGEATFAEAANRRYSGFKKGIRPFRDNPYVFVSYGEGGNEVLFESTVRFYVEKFHVPKVAFITEIPLMHSWSFGVGIEARTGGTKRRAYEFDGETLIGFDRDVKIPIGLRGELLGGIVEFVGDIRAKGAFMMASWSW